MSHVRRVDEGPTVVLQLDRAPVGAIDLGTMEELVAEIERLHAAPPDGGVVLTGTGTAFSAGVDVKALGRYDADEKRRMVAGIDRLVTAVYTLGVPTVAAVNGHALGGGLVLALACDYRFAADVPCRIGLTEVTAGVPYPAVPLEIVRTELAAPARRVLALTGRVLLPHEALALGVVDEVVPRELLAARAVARAAELALLPAYAAVKAQLRAGAADRLADLARSDPLLRSWV